MDKGLEALGVTGSSLMELAEIMVRYCDTLEYPDNFEDIQKQFLDRLNEIWKFANVSPMFYSNPVLIDVEIKFDTLFVTLEYGDGVDSNEREFAFPMNVVKSNDPGRQMKINSLTQRIQNLDYRILTYSRNLQEAELVRAGLTKELDDQIELLIEQHPGE